MKKLISIVNFILISVITIAFIATVGSFVALLVLIFGIENAMLIISVLISATMYVSTYFFWHTNRKYQKEKDEKQEKERAEDLKQEKERAEDLKREEKREALRLKERAEDIKREERYRAEDKTVRGTNKKGKKYEND